MPPPRENTILMAVWVESIHSASQAFVHNGYICNMCAAVRGVSTDNKLILDFETNALSRRLFEELERLSHYGFTVIEIPEEWQNEYQRPHDWRDKLINTALEQTAIVPQHDTGATEQAGYDVELANLVLDILNKSYPHPVLLTRVKHQLSNEPSDGTLLNALDALVGDGYVEGKYLLGSGKLRAMESIKITGDGRKHLQEEMKRKSANSSQAFHINNASTFILTHLLSEFLERNLKSNDLRKTYRGFSPAQLKDAAIAKGISEVDFDLSMMDLETHNFVRTGPMVPFENPPGVAIIALRSKREYSCLTVEGYRKATELATKPQAISRSSAPTQSVIHGDQINNYGHAASIGRQSHGQINYQDGWSEQQLQSLASELELLRVECRKSATSREDDRQVALLAEAAEEAEKGNGQGVATILSKIGKKVWEMAQSIGTDLAAKAIAEMVNPG